jgi:hypothetical protein
MGEVLALSAWLGLEALHGGPSIAGRGLDAQTGDPVAGAAIVIDGRTAAAAGADGVFSACRFDAPGRRTRHRGARGQPRSPDGASVDRVHCLVHVESTLLTVARTGQYSSGLRKAFPVAPSIGLSVQF